MADHIDSVAPLLLKPEAVAKRLQFGRSKTYQLMREGAIPSVLIGGSRRVRARDLERFVERLGEPPAA